MRAAFRPFDALAFLTVAAVASLANAAPAPPSEEKSDPEKYIYARLTKFGVFRHAQLTYAIAVQGVRGRKLLKPVIVRMDAGGDVEWVMGAREGEVRVDTAKKVLLYRMRKGSALAMDGSRAYFEDRVGELPLPDLRKE